MLGPPDDARSRATAQRARDRPRSRNHGGRRRSRPGRRARRRRRARAARARSRRAILRRAQLRRRRERQGRDSHRRRAAPARDHGRALRCDHLRSARPVGQRRRGALYARVLAALQGRASTTAASSPCSCSSTRPRRTPCAASSRRSSTSSRTPPCSRTPSKAWATTPCSSARNGTEPIDLDALAQPPRWPRLCARRGVAARGRVRLGARSHEHVHRRRRVAERLARGAARNTDRNLRLQYLAGEGLNEFAAGRDLQPSSTARGAGASGTAVRRGRRRSSRSFGNGSPAGKVDTDRRQSPCASSRFLAFSSSACCVLSRRGGSTESSSSASLTSFATCQRR